MPLTVQLNASSSYDLDGSISSYFWSSSDGQSKAGSTASFVFTTANNYTITLTVTDNNGATATKLSTIQALTLPKPTDSAVKPSPTQASCSNVALISVVDGDTIYVDNNGSHEKVRISQVDEPEKSQAYGQEAKECLINILAEGNISICRDGKDKYGRTVANVTTNNNDVAHQLVKQGCAWAYTKYLEAGSDLPNIESQAKNSGIGLWSAGNLVSPWDYRHGTVPVTVTASGITAIPVTIETTATIWDRILDWAEHKYPQDLTNGSTTQSLEDGMKYRCYYKGTELFCAGIKGNDVYTYDGKEIVNIGNTQIYINQAQQDGF